MKLIGVLPLGAAVLARALVAPASAQEPLAGGAASSAAHHNPSWWDSLPSKDALASAFDEAIDLLGSGLDSAVHAVDDIQARLQGQLKEAIANAAGDGADGAGGHGSADLTIYQLISLSNHTKRFAKIVDEHPAVVKLLNSTEANYTLFVPVDDAFKHIPDGHDKPSKEYIEDVLLYHVGLGRYSAHRILGTHTLPTALDEKFLGGEPQRLRTSVGLTGVKLNFYSKVIAANVVRNLTRLHQPPPNRY